MRKPTKLHSTLSNRLEELDDDAWIEFLLEEGIDALAAFHAIKNPATRAKFIRDMEEAARSERRHEGNLN